MRKLVAILCVLLLLIPTVAMAEVDLSHMTFDELVALKEQINLALWNSSDWQEVSVPTGVYTVGEDIPAGKWTIKAADGVYTSVQWGDMLDESGVGLDFSGEIYEYETLYSPTYSYFTEAQDKTEVSYDVKDGQFVIISDGTAVFSPFSGGASLGFK